mgnify:CR=1 FL=1
MFSTHRSGRKLTLQPMTVRTDNGCTCPMRQPLLCPTRRLLLDAHRLCILLHTTNSSIGVSNCGFRLKKFVDRLLPKALTACSLGFVWERERVCVSVWWNIHSCLLSIFSAKTTRAGNRQFPSNVSGKGNFSIGCNRKLSEYGALVLLVGEYVV